MLNGTVDYLTVPDSEDWNFGSGDFTIESKFVGVYGENLLLSGNEINFFDKIKINDYVKFLHNNKIYKVNTINNINNTLEIKSINDVNNTMIRCTHYEIEKFDFFKGTILETILLNNPANIKEK